MHNYFGFTHQIPQLNNQTNLDVFLNIFSISLDNTPCMKHIAYMVAWGLQ